MSEWVEQPIVWGPIVDGMGRIGIRIKVKETDTQVELAIDTIIWTKEYLSSWGSNTATYFDNLSSIGSATTYQGPMVENDSDASFEDSNWSENFQFSYDTHTYTYQKNTTASTRYIYAKVLNILGIGGTMTAGTTYRIPKLDGYVVSYDANGGNGAPSAQVKPYDVELTLSSITPTRAGHMFQGWATSAGGSVAYSPGSAYNTNDNITLYAVWKANTYTVNYNANGGSDAPPNQIKTYSVALTLSYAKPTRTNYAFVGWGTSASSSTVSYMPGDSYTTNAEITLYAIWVLSYTKPKITNLKVARCDSDKTLSDQGKCALVSFDWSADRDITGIKIEWKPSVEDVWSSSVQLSQSGTDGSVSECIGGNAISIEYTYDVRITVSDTHASTEVIRSLAGTKFVIDLLGGGNGISFGVPASTPDCMDVNFDTRFRKPVHLDNARGVFGKTSSGADASLLDLNSSNETNIAYGGYEKRVGKTNLYGNELNLYSNGNVNINPAASGATSLSGTTVNVSAKNGDANVSAKNGDANMTANADINLSANADINLSADNVNVASSLHLEKTTDASGTANNNPALTIGSTSGTHLELDGNDIMAKSSGNSTGPLYINSDGGTVYINGCAMAVNKVLWSAGAGWWMDNSQTCVLEDAVSNQPNGIVLIWSQYAYGANYTDQYNVFFVPKEFVANCDRDPEGSHLFSMPCWTGTGRVFAGKGVRISNTTITGNKNNALESWVTECGIRTTPQYFALMYVIGV